MSYEQSFDWRNPHHLGGVVVCIIVVVLLVSGMIKKSITKEVVEPPPPPIVEVVNNNDEHVAKSAGRWFGQIKDQWKRGWAEGIQGAEEGLSYEEVVSNVTNNTMEDTNNVVSTSKSL